MSELIGFVLAFGVLVALAAVARETRQKDLVSHLLGLVIVVSSVGASVGMVVLLATIVSPG